MTVGHVTIHPYANEHAVATAAHPTSTARRPRRSERRPMEDAATRPMRLNDAAAYAPSCVASSAPDPDSAKLAATKAGTHAHMPRSSQLCAVYPAINSIALRLVRTSPTNARPSCRGWTTFGVSRSAPAASAVPATEPAAVTTKATG